MKQFDVSFLPFNKTVKLEEGRTLLDAARKADITLQSLCNGKGRCGKCKVRILSKAGFSGLTRREKRVISEEEVAKGIRLACQTEVFGDLVLEVPEESIFMGFVKDKVANKGHIPIQPFVNLYPIEITPPSLSNNESDVERIKRALKESYNVEVSKIDSFCFKDRPLTIRKENWKVNVIVSGNEEILDIRPVKDRALYGIAVDIGTTTIGAYLYDLKDGYHLTSGSMLNPQIKFGADIMSRIGYIGEKGTKGLVELHKCLIKGLNSLIGDMCRKIGISRRDIFDVTVVGNTVMHHIFLNINPLGLGISPFTPYLTSSINIKARDLGITINPSGNIYVLPVKGGFIGADNIGVVLAIKPYLSDYDHLIIDIGTNGEIVVGNKKRLVCASCATGPALEGAHIRYGMRADTGAIEKVSIDLETKEVKYAVIGGGRPKG
ncbi:MAG TPA: ASKHA domain-containing protein, partial [Syntrophorhabdaceae bacterium]|nr:ASKHA domain-containing protein [Syntrophorhabdaceae bacterium]